MLRKIHLDFLQMVYGKYSLLENTTQRNSIVIGNKTPWLSIVLSKKFAEQSKN